MQNFVKTIINAAQSWTKKEIKNEINNIPIVQPDWNQNDASAVDYVKNRTHWVDGLVEEAILEQQIVSNGDSIECRLIAGQAYKVTWDNEIYHCIAWRGDNVVGLGDGDFKDIGKGEEVPFLIFNNNIYCEHGKEYTISITTLVENIHKLDSKYLDLPTNLATTDDVQDVANNKMDKSNPVGTGSFSMNRKAGTTIGQYSHAEGYDTTASGEYSHAEGLNTIAASRGQHVQGKNNIVDSDKTYAHIVGNGASSHVRSNAYTLDWNGNANFAGDVYVGNANENKAGKRLVTEEYAINLKKTTVPLDMLSMVYGNGKFVSTNNSEKHVYYSEDGINWIEGNFPETSVANSSSTFHALAYGNGKFVAIGERSLSGLYPQSIFYSEDGVTWNEASLLENASLDCIAYGNGRFVAIKKRDIFYSEDGITWTKNTFTFSNNFQSVAYGNGKFIAVGHSGINGVNNAAIYSEDGVTWNNTYLPDIGYPWAEIGYGNGKFIAFGNGGASAYSEDGITWIRNDLPSSNTFQSLACGNGKFVAVGGTNTSTAAYSEDGIAWMKTILPIEGNWVQVAYGDEKFVAVGSEGELAYSKDGIIWHSYNVLIQNNKDITSEVRDLMLPIFTPTTVGQLLSVKATDKNGKPTEWETVDPWVINSSTEGSTKKFKVTIDDTGTLTVSEIVTEEVE